MGRTEEKECPKKGVLGRDIKSSSTGVTAAIHPCPQRLSFSLPLILFFFLSFSLSLFPPDSLSFSLYFSSSPFRLPCLAKARRLSLKVTRRNRQRVTRACKRVEERERTVEGKERRESSGGWWAAGTTRQTVHALFALCHGYRRKSPKGKYAKQRPPPHCSPSVVSLPSFSFSLFECTSARAFSASLSLPPSPLFIPQFCECMLNLS